MTHNPIGMRQSVIALAIPMLIACGTSDNPATGPGTTANDLFWATELNHRAITMAVGQTLQLKATAYSAPGNEMPNLSQKVIYSSSDTARAIVTPNGLVTARAAGTGVLIVAKIHSDELNVTNSDTARLNITATAPAVTGFSIQPDSTLIAGDEEMYLSARITGPSGNIPSVSVRYFSANQAALTVNPNTGLVYANYLGTTKAWAVATIYGTVWTDTVAMTVTHPVWASIQITNMTYNNTYTPLYVQPYTLTVRKGATVQFRSTSPTKTSVTFDNPEAVTGGNIPEFSNSSTTRVFPLRGTYTFRVSGVEKVGTITVVD